MSSNERIRWIKSKCFPSSKESKRNAGDEFDGPLAAAATVEKAQGRRRATGSFDRDSRHTHAFRLPPGPHLPIRLPVRRPLSPRPVGRFRFASTVGGSMRGLAALHSARRRANINVVSRPPFIRPAGGRRPPSALDSRRFRSFVSSPRFPALTRDCPRIWGEDSFCFRTG